MIQKKPGQLGSDMHAAECSTCQSQESVLTSPGSHAEVLGQEYRKRIDPLLGQDSAWENPAAALDPTQSIGRSPEATALRIETEDLISELRVRRPELVAKSDESRYLEAVHYAVVARQLLHYHAALAQTSEKRQAILLGIRDAMMAENLAYIVSREQGRGHVLIFAHNSHLKRGKVQWQWGNETVIWWPVGSHLHELFGHRYAGYQPGRFSLNVKGGRCEACQGEGIVKIEMDFLHAAWL